MNIRDRVAEIIALNIGDDTYGEIADAILALIVEELPKINMNANFTHRAGQVTYKRAVIEALKH